MRTAVVIAASLIGLSGVGAFASGVYHRRPFAGGDSGAHTPVVVAPVVKLDNTLAGDTSAVGTYCPIPPRGAAHKDAGTTASAAPSAADSLLLGAQSVAPDTAKALCTGTAAPEKRP